MRCFPFRSALTLILLAGTLIGCQMAQNEAADTERAPAAHEAPHGETLGDSAEESSGMEAPNGMAKRALQAAAPPAHPAGGSANEQAARPGEKPRAGDSQPATAGLYIIRRAQLTLQVKDVRESLRQVAAIATAAGGFVADSSFSTAEGETPQANLTLRVPAQKFDALLDQMGGVGTVFERGINSEDVSLSYVDTESRIRNLRESEASLRKILERSGKLSEVLEVERELGRVRGEIEQAQGRLRHLSNQVSLATIRVTLSEKVQQVSTSPWAVIPSTIENAWQNVGRALAGTFASLAESSIWLVAYILPLSVPLVLLYCLLGMGLRHWLVTRQGWFSDTWFIRAWLGVGVVALTYAVPGLGGMLVTVAVVALGITAIAWLGQMVRERFKKPAA